MQAALYFIDGAESAEGNREETIKLRNVHDGGREWLRAYSRNPDIVDAILDFVDAQETRLQPHQNQILTFINNEGRNFGRHVVLFANFARVPAEDSELITKIAPDDEVGFIHVHNAAFLFLDHVVGLSYTFLEVELLLLLQCGWIALDWVHFELIAFAYHQLVVAYLKSDWLLL